jgi:hypothetical protein
MTDMPLFRRNLCACYQRRRNANVIRDAGNEAMKKIAVADALF